MSHEGAALIVSTVPPGESRVSLCAGVVSLGLAAPRDVTLAPTTRAIHCSTSRRVSGDMAACPGNNLSR